MKKQKYFFLILCLLFPFNAFPQFVPGTGNDKITVHPNAAPQKIVLKTSLIAPFEVRRGIRLSTEITLNDHLSIQPELGYYFKYDFGLFSLDKAFMNFEQRLSLRYYIPEKFVEGLYTGPLFTFSSFNYSKGEWRNFSKTQSDSFAFLDFRNAGQYHENDYGAYWTIGLQPVLSRHFTFDIFGGIGLQMQQTITKSDPYQPAGTFSPFTVTAFKFLGILDLHVGYVF